MTDVTAVPDLPALGRLKGRRVVITGAASGIGLGTARLFAAEGAALTLIDRNADALAAVASAFGAQAQAADVTDEDAVEHAVAAGGQAMGGIDGVVNAAGIQVRGSIEEVSVAQWRHVLEVNMTGTYAVIRSCLPWLRQSPGASVVNIGSAQSLLPNKPNRTAYAASKGGVLNLTRSLAAELAPAIRVNSVCPGLVDTPMAEGMHGNARNYALGRLAQPVEIARAILFLISAESSYVTGAVLAADGGRSFH